jgi:ABC-2 type transport system ATP-binding protein
MICGLLKPDSGEVIIHGSPISKAGDRIRSRVGVCPQDIVLWERLTCIEQLQFIGQMYGVPGRTARERGERLLEELDLKDKRTKLARTLSGGMQRRLNLAMALVHDPKIVVLDEPEAGLDPQSRIKVREYIQSLARVKTVILTTHNMDEADRVADRVAIIDHGKLMVLDTPETLKGQVGEGDIIEIGAPNLGEVGQDQVQACIEDIVKEIFYDLDKKTLAVRALNAVRVLPIILDKLEGTGLQPTEVQIRENTLEDVFIQLTGRRLRE